MPDLDDAEVVEWNYIVEQLDAMGTLAVSDRYVIASLCHAVVEERELRTLLREKGRTYEAFVILGEDGKPVSIDAAKVVVKARPEVAMLKNARAEIYRFSTLLGLDPSSRSRLHVTPPAQRNETIDLLSPSSAS